MQSNISDAGESNQILPGPDSPNSASSGTSYLRSTMGAEYVYRLRMGFYSLSRGESRDCVLWILACQVFPAKKAYPGRKGQFPMNHRREVRVVSSVLKRFLAASVGVLWWAAVIAEGAQAARSGPDGDESAAFSGELPGVCE